MSNIVISPTPSRAELDLLGEIAASVAKSKFFKDAPEASRALTKALMGRDYGISPLQSQTAIHLIDGKPSLSSALLAALVRRSDRYDYAVTQHDDDGCAIEFYGLVRGEWQLLGTSTFGKADAATAGLTGKDNYKKYPKNMFFSRALSNGVTWFCPDLVNGPVYTPEEMGDEGPIEVPEDAEVVEQVTITDAVFAEVTEIEVEDMEEVKAILNADKDDPRWKKELRTLHAVGTEVYGKGWNESEPGGRDGQRHALVLEHTRGQTDSAGDLGLLALRALVAKLRALQKNPPVEESKEVHPDWEATEGSRVRGLFKASSMRDTLGLRYILRRIPRLEEKVASLATDQDASVLIEEMNEAELNRLVAILNDSNQVLRYDIDGFKEGFDLGLAAYAEQERTEEEVQAYRDASLAYAENLFSQDALALKTIRAYLSID